MYRVRRRIQQSNVLVASESHRAIETAFASIIHHRRSLEAYMQTHPMFQWALDPVVVDIDAPRVARLAAGATEIAGVGPMAAIPGALAELALEAMLATGSRTNIIENGGEIARCIDSASEDWDLCRKICTLRTHWIPSVSSGFSCWHSNEFDYGQSCIELRTDRCELWLWQTPLQWQMP